MTHPRAGQLAQPSDLIDLDALIGAYYDLAPDPDNPDQQVVFGTSGHRGSAFDAAFNQAHILAITQAIIEYRQAQGTTGPLYLAKDTHGLSAPAWRTALEVLVANGVEVRAEREDEYTPTPALSRAVINHNRGRQTDQADGIVVTPSHNPPRDGGFKYNPPNGGPADTDATSWIAQRANQWLRQPERVPRSADLSAVTRWDYRSAYCADLRQAVDFEAIAAAGVRLGVDPMGGASIQYWQYLAETAGLDLTVVNNTVDPTWRFMTLDHDGQIRMDCSSPYAMASLVRNKDSFDLACGNDADADRHGIVTPDAGLMNPNHYLAAVIWYLFTHRPQWPANAAVGKTLVSSSIIDQVAADLGRRLVETPVGFKWFVPGLISGQLGFGGEESAGASSLTRQGQTWTTDKDGLLLDLLAAEILASTGHTPSQLYAQLTNRHGAPSYARVDAPASRELKARLARLEPDDVAAERLAGDPITAKLTRAPGNDAPIGGLKVVTDRAWFAARPSGTENVYKIYAESWLGPDHLALVQAEAKAIVDAAAA
ncbi:MAG: phosphoglucomutase (alpha-D-glucose-1,6-bisphosphate-dependent) [Propionibacteriaceae bacterium]|jgi:phosphoglucomutase|nr:phosphoglucomutase (alpha-D-glucose-1,6-bisphosphate-dependent) [Propionibacteriaceae bacterium]